MIESVSPPPALDRASRLLQEPPVAPDAAQGFLDLIGDRGAAPAGLAQALMVSRSLPVIYERWWRPFLGWVLKGGLSGPGMAEEHHMARQRLALREGHNVLDVACGPGNFTRGFGRAVGRGGLAVGLDASPSMLARAVWETQGPNVAYVRADAAELPFADGSFDAVCCFAALNMFALPFYALDHMVRVLAPGGRIVILTSCRPGSIIGRAAGAAVTRSSGMRMFGRTELTDALEARGLLDVGQRVAGLGQFVWGTRDAGTN